MLGHLSFGVEDLGRAADFYDRILAPLGYVRVWSNERGAGFGEKGGGDKLVLFARPGEVVAPGTGFHLAFDAPSRAAVDAFHAAAIAAGGKDVGAPGPRPRYSVTYYAAFVIDLDGYKLDAVHHSGQGIRVMAERLLEIRGLKTYFRTDDGPVQAVDGVDLTIDRGETLGVVGESGCGKTVTAMTTMKLIAMPPGYIAGGQILWQGRDLVPLDAAAMRQIRAKEIAIIFQEPMTSLNPVYTIGEQIAEVIRLHEGMNRKDALDKTIEMLRLVKIPNPERRVRDYPHQFSGGMRQRVMIAMALSCNPKLLIADEPTTALDVTIQAQILELLGEMKAKFGMAVMLITHAMGVVAETAQRVVVMYAGKVVEEAPVGELFRAPRHPYTQGLIRSIPRIDTAATKKTRLEAIGGVVPSLLNPPPGCRFAPRCRYARAECTAAMPELREVAPGHKVRCIL